MNPTTLNQLRSHLLDVVDKYKEKFRSHLVVNTTSTTPRDSVVLVAKETLQALEHFADEEVLCVPKSKLNELVRLPFQHLVQPQWDAMYSLVDQCGTYLRRSKAEAEGDWMQIVPVCVIEHSGKLLTNVRSEPGESLDKALANWAGGHVRKQDLETGHSKWESVIAGLRREVLEELSIAQLPKPEPLGLVHTAENARAARHLGVVFKVHLDDPATAEALDNKIIREPPNKSVRTAWMDREQLSARTQTQKDWSRAINRHLFPSEPT
jgi:predicted NUDIX family phosphoesterase